MDPTPSSDAATAPDQPIAWRAVPENTPVRSDGHVFVPADDGVALTATHGDVSLSAGELGALPEHTDEHQFQLGMVGLLRKHVGWVKEKDR